MAIRRVWSAVAVGLLIGLLGGALVSVPAAAATAEPTIATTSWYWEEARSEEIRNPDGSTTTVETPSPFCPGFGSGLGSPSNTCAQQRLPVEIRRGDYETPNKLSAVAFDLSLIPVGSEVSKFVVTFREAKAGCYETDGKPDQDPRDDQCEETDPQNLGKHKLQACLVNSYFGEGEAREYSEVPNYTCSDSDPIATRKEVKSEKDGPGSDFYWTFDLTSYAQDWLKKFSTNTGVVLTGVPLNKDDTETWRVVLAGPKFENGFTSQIVYIEPEVPVFAPPPGTTTGTGTGTDFSGTGTSGDFGTTTTSTDTGDFGDTSTAGGTDPVSAGGDEPPALATKGAEETPQGLPGYVWLALLAGFAGFALVRSVVLESSAGIRPDGVLATIHRMNADRVAAATPSDSPLS
ncbi:MAG: hypothetical protein M3238_05260, partial [Actinomycetota bacterium]|nr:hypothetical protein [Actinomycetota bacterium]